MNGERQNGILDRHYDRRTLLRATLGAAGVAFLAACGANATATTGPAATAAGGGQPTAGGTAVPSGAATAAPAGGSTATAPAAAAARAATSATGAAPANLEGKKPSPAEGVPDAYTKLPPAYRSRTSAPGKGSKVTAFQISYDPPLPPRDRNSFLQELEKRMGISQYDVTLAPASSYEEKFAAAVAAGDLPDLVLMTPPPGWQKIVQQGAFADLTPYLAGDALREYPNLAAFPSVLWKNVAFNKKIYGVPRPRFLGNNAYYFRQDWAEKVGFTQQKNAEDVFQMFTAFTKGDPDGNGKADTYALSTSAPRPDFGIGTTAGPIAQMFRVPNEWRLNPDGTLTAAVETDEFKQALAYARRLWEAGLFHPDAKSLQTTQNKDLFYTSKIGAYPDGLAGLFGSTGAYGKTRERTPDANVSAWVPVGHDGGKPTYHKYIGYFGWTAITAKAGKDQERVKELLRILDYFASPFGSEEAIFNANGIEGTHHTVKEDGTRVKTDLGKTEIGTGTYTGLTNAPPVAYYDLPGNAEAMQEIQQGLLANGVDNPTWGFYSATQATKNAELQQLEADRRLEIVTGGAPLGAWDQFLKDWKSRGGDQIRQEYQEALRG